MLESWRRSGLSIERFAKQRGFTPQRLYCWKRKIVLAAQHNEPKLVPVHVKQEAKRGEPVTVLLRTGHVLKVDRCRAHLGPLLLRDGSRQERAMPAGFF